MHLQRGGPALVELLIKHGCSQFTAQALTPFASALANLSDILGVSRFKEFLSLIESLAGQRTALIVVQEDNIKLRQQLEQARFASADERLRAAAALDAEQRVQADLRAQLRDLSTRFVAVQGAQRSQAYEWDAAYQGAQSGYNAALAEKSRHVLRYQETLDGLSRERDGLVAQLRHTEVSHACVQDELEQERAHRKSVELQSLESKARLVNWNAVLATRTPCFAELARFMHEDAPRLAASSDFTLSKTAAIPVLVLEWVPDLAELDLSPSWATVTSTGVFGLLFRLSAGYLVPTHPDLELTVCHTGGRWVGAVGGGAEAHRLAALILFQALRMDITVTANCRVVDPPQNLRTALRALPQDRRGAPRLGVDRCPAAQLRPQPTTNEAMLRCFLKGCPFEKELLGVLTARRPSY